MDKIRSPRWSLDCEVYPFAVRQFRLPTVDKPKCVDLGLFRGNISGFSRHAALRLREFFSTKTLRGRLYAIYGVTITLPWRSLSFGAACCEYRAAFNRFGVYFRRRFPNSYIVFRHELQVRRMPHCHCVLYLACEDKCIDLLRVIGSLWLAAMMYQIHGGDIIGWARYGICIDCLSDAVCAFRYIADHASKHKRKQLGYIGKQWGVLGRCNSCDIIPTRLSFPSLELRNAFFRTVSKICRFRITDERCVFGSRLSRKVYVRSISYVAEKTCLALYRAMVAHPERFSRHTADDTLAFHLVLRSMV